MSAISIYQSIYLYTYIYIYIYIWKIEIIYIYIYIYIYISIFHIYIYIYIYIYIWKMEIPPHMAEQKQDDQLEHIYSSYVRIRDEDLTEAMNDREKWLERLRDIRASGTTWWWYIYIYILSSCRAAIYIYIYTRIVEKVPSLTQILDLSHTSRLSIGLNRTGIKTEIWINLIRCGRVMSQQKYTAIILLSRKGYELFE